MENDTHQPTPAPLGGDGQLDVLERLGNALKDARLQRGMERSALASKLCMGEEQLAALENADQSRLPESVFVIAQSRRVADALGLDISLLIAPLKAAPSPSTSRPGAEALGRLPSRSSSTPRRSGSVQPLPRKRRSGGGSLRWLGGAAMLAGLAAAGVWAWPSLRQLANKQLSLGPLAAAPAPIKPRPPKPAAPIKPSVPADQVQLKASQPSWLEVQNNQRAVLFKGSFKGERLFPLGQGLKLLAGRPDLVTISIGGSAAKPLGTIDQIRWVSVPTTQPAAKAPAPAP